MEQPAPSNSQRPMKLFAQNVGVNVLANLIAAAIIYLLGVGFELLPANRGLIVLALMFLGLGGGLGLNLLGFFVLRQDRMRRSLRFVGTGSLLVSASLLLPSAWLYLAGKQPMPMLILGYGGFFFVTGSVLLLHSRNMREDGKKLSRS